MEVKKITNLVINRAKDSWVVEAFDWIEERLQIHLRLLILHSVNQRVNHFTQQDNQTGFQMVHIVNCDPESG